MIKVSPVLTNKNFLMLWIPQILTVIGQNALTYVLGVRIWQETGSNTAVGTLLVATAIPGVLFGLIAGAYVDRWDTKRTIIITNLLRTGLILFFILALNNHIFIYPLIFLLSTVTHVFVPAEASAIPHLVQKNQLISANSLFTLSFTLATALGFLLSTPALRVLGIEGSIISAFALFVFSSFLTFLLPKIEGRSKAQGVFTIFVELFNAAKLLATHKLLRGGFTALVLANSLVLILSALVPGYAAKTLGVDAEDASLFVLAPVILGIVIGTLFLNGVRNDTATVKLPKIGILLMGVALFCTSFSEQYFFGRANILISTFMLFVFGLANALTTVPSTTIIHQHTPSDFQGKIFGFINSFSAGVSLLPILLTGGVADVFGVPTAMKVLGLSVFLFGFYRLRGILLRK